MKKALKKLFKTNFGEVERLREENKALKDELNSCSEVLNGVNLAIWRRNKDLDIKYYNLAYSKIIEGNQKESSATEGIELYNNSRELASLSIKNNFSETVRRHIVVAGERRLFQITETPTKNGTVGFAHDITELEEKENTLEQNAETQKNLLEASASSIAIYGSNKKLKYFNNAFSNTFKLNERWLETGPDYGEILEALREKRKLPEQANFLEFKKENIDMFTNLLEKHEEFYYLPDGRVFRVIVLPHEYGGLLFNYENMTDQIALERSYNTLLSVNRSTLDNLYEAVVVFGEDGRLQLSNPVYSKIWSLDPTFARSEPHISEILEETKSLYIHDDWEPYKQNIITFATKREPSQQRLQRSDGKVFEWSCVPLPDGATLMTYIDVTDSTRVENSLRAEKEALEEADNIKTNFLTSVSYELRSPLTSIRGFSEIILEKYFGDINKKQEEYVKGILDSSMQLGALIDNILDVSYIDAGYMTLEINEFDIKEALEGAVNIAREDIKKKSQKINIKYPKNIGKMFGDSKRIKQVIVNLINNASKLGNTGDEILLSSSTKGKGNIIISVESPGKGIPKEDHQFIFEKFYRLDKEGRSGTGLGLTIAKSFVELHGGNISFESEENKGVKFSCEFLRKNPDFIETKKKKAS